MTPRALGLAALGVSVAHAAAHLLHGDHPSNLLWVCNLAAPAVGLGLLLRAPLPLAIGTLCLALGVPLWLADLALGADLLWTSWLVHLGGLAIGLLGVRRLGLARGAWWKAILAVLGVQGLCRLVTPAAENVNMVFAVQAGWGRLFGGHLAAYAAGLGFHAAGFFAVDRALRRFVAPREAA